MSSVVTLITQSWEIFDESDSRFLVELQKQKKIFQIEIFTHWALVTSTQLQINFIDSLKLTQLIAKLQEAQKRKRPRITGSL